MSVWRTRGSILLSAALLHTVSGGAVGPSVDIGIKDRANAFASMAANGKFVAIAWGAATQGTTDVYAAVSRDGGRSFAAPARANDVATSANVSGEQPPRVALAPHANHDPSIIVVWTAKSDAGTRLLTARSDDGGKSFAAATAVAGTEAPGNRGWESIAAGARRRSAEASPRGLADARPRRVVVR